MRHLPVLLLLGLAACEAPAPEYVFPVSLNASDLGPFEVFSPDVGVHPDRTVVLDPNNPFRDGIVGDGPLRFEALDAGPVAGFYAFATANASIAFGENQYFAADNLRVIYQQERVADPADLGVVRDLALRGYQTVLDEFSDTAFTFDESGRFQFDLLVPTVQGILDLGGEPANGWRIVTGPDGAQVAVQSGG